MMIMMMVDDDDDGDAGHAYMQVEASEGVGMSKSLMP
jgi:hypothetical protein